MSLVELHTVELHTAELHTAGAGLFDLESTQSSEALAQHGPSSDHPETGSGFLFHEGVLFQLCPRRIRKSGRYEHRVES